MSRFLKDIVRVVSDNHFNHFGFIVLRRIRIELGITCSTAELLRRMEPEAELEPATPSLSTITQSCDPSKMAKDGEETASMFLDGNRTRTAQVFTQDGTPPFVLVEDNRSSSASKVACRAEARTCKARFRTLCFGAAAFTLRCAASEGWGGQTDSHRHKRLHGA